MSDTIRVAATSDFHYTKHCQGRLRDLLVHASHNADVLCICGDLTDYGLPEEAHVLCEDLKKHLSIPCVAVLGNHDFESGKVGEVVDVFDSAGVHMLDGDSFEIEGVHIAGVCGFGGGFDSKMLNSWGEPLIKSFVQEAVDHSLRLEKALSRGGESKRKVAITHYAPIRGTVEGENLEIFPFLGSTRLEGPINRQSVKVAFHGHAHGGSPEGKTSAGIPVYNVAVQVLHKHLPEQAAFRVVEV
jgi:Icc-related predicted phosphoesterase